MASKVCIKRLMAELKSFEDSDKYTVEYDEANFLEWDIILEGPQDTPYSGGEFKMRFNFPENYPFKPFECKFLTRVYHPNVSSNGNVCLLELKNKWSNATTVMKILQSIESILMNPNPDDPLDEDIAQQYTNDNEIFKKTAQEWTNNYAK